MDNSKKLTPEEKNTQCSSLLSYSFTSKHAAMSEIVKDVHHYQETSEDGAIVTTYWIIEKTSGIYEVFRVEPDESRTLLEPDAGNEVVNRFLNSQL